MSTDRLDDLLQRGLDDELDAAERTELAEILARDPAARRRRDEFVALESLLFAVGSTERVDPAHEAGAASVPPEDAAWEPGAWHDAPREEATWEDAGPEDAVLATAGAWIPSVVGPLVIALLVWIGLGDPPATVAEAPPTFAVTSISDGWLAVPAETENPDIQIVWVYALARNDTNDSEPVEGTNR